MLYKRLFSFFYMAHNVSQLPAGRAGIGKTNPYLRVGTFSGSLFYVLRYCQLFFYYCT